MNAPHRLLSRLESLLSCALIASAAETTREEWALQAPERPPLPTVENRTWPATPIDFFVLARLEKAGLRPSAEADRATLIRRLSFDLTGLPPTPNEVRAFVSDPDANAYANLVERLLASPRYGERWARHWLDVVRFAESNGFETNLERRNAWPYRDYVIRAFNEDKPYNQFILEQLAGDSLGVDEATGFIVGGPWDAVKSPDVNLTMQQRMDELHDMVSTTASTFLGLTVGCARCHDHKFDPISQRDYYAMQAIFAGVQHGERALRTPDYDERIQAANALHPLIARIDTQLAYFSPPANPNLDSARISKTPNPRLNEERFGPVDARFVRFTIYETLGSAEPCLDELEIYSAGENSQNVALASSGAKPTASGTFPNSDLHKLEHINDGKTGNAHSWISSEAGRGWVQIELPKTLRIDRILWGRDRESQYKDRLPTAYTIEVGRTAGQWEQVAGRPPLRLPVHPRLNVERFAPVPASWVRFTVLATTGLEPCLDELEVYPAAEPERNIALASGGTIATASGTCPNSERHKLEHLNDGQFGNDRSWISSETGRGWVQLKFPEPVVVNKVVWSRDREGHFADRLATHYEIAVALSTNDWKVVAGSNDRQSYVPNAQPTPSYSLAGLSQDEVKQLNRLLGDKKDLANRIQKLRAFPMAYAGRFEKPGPTYRLNRGEAMQPREQVAPGAIERLGRRLELPVDAPESERRLALAHWLTSWENPLPARVMVNRLWQYHFGRGLVETPSDFGRNGARPTHPELLDWLACDFIARNWSIKSVQRWIVLSSTYRQSSAPNSDAARMDAGDRLLWRFPPQRLEAEPLRDAILQVSGNLDLRMGGPGFDLFEPNGNYVKVYNSKKTFGPPEWRRMVYQSKPRMRLDDTFGAFDCPDAGQIAPKRTSSTTPLQALNLLNSPFIVEEAERFARRLEKEAASEPGAQVRRAFWLAFSREPAPAEIRASVSLIREHGLIAFCRALFNANEFVYVF